MVRVGSSKTIYISKIFMFFIAISCSCFTASWVGAQDLRATNFKVEPFDGRRGNKGDYTGAWIRLQGVTINGDRIGRSSVGFEFSGNYPNQPMRNFGFSSERTFTDLPRRAADRTHESLGYRFWVDARSGSQKARQKYQMLNETDKILMKGICGLMSDERFVTNVLSQMTNSRPNSYYDYVDNKYNQYWGNERRKREVLRLANICNRGIGNAGSQKVAFELKSMPSVKLSLCGFELENVQTISNLKSIQRGLANRDLYNGGIDGKFGKGSCSALTKWSKCENVGSKVLSDGALSKLIKTNPSARELACYGKTTDNVAKLTFSDFQLRPVDGRSEGRDIVGSWITLRNVKIDGNPGAKKTIWFEILGRFPSQRMEMIGFSSKRTFENMPEYIGEKFGNPNLGYGFAVRTQNVAGTRSRFQQLDKNDRLVLKGICGLMANESFVADVVKKLESQKEFGFRDYVDNQFMKFWKKGSKAREIVSVAESCNRSVGNTGAKSVAFVSSNNSPSVTPASGSIAAVSSCNQRKLQVRSNQNVLKSLDLYTSTVDGVSGPNYRKAVAGGEKLLGQWSDAKQDCLGVTERKILEAVVAARKRGSSCEYLPNSTEIKNRFNGLQSAGVIDRAKLDHEKASGLIWMIDTVSDLEMRLSFLNFYSSTNSSIRDCRLDNEELKALKPEPEELPVSSEIPAESISMAVVKTAGSATLSLVVEGSDLETSLVSKSIFGLSNQVKMDIIFDMSGGSPILDLVVSEDDTKINLHFFDNYSQSAGFAAGLKELTLGKTPNDQSAFRIRMLDNGKSNIDNGDFRKLLSKMPSKDQAMIAALCGHVAGVSTSSEGFEAQFLNAEDKATFRSSLFSNPQVRSAVNKLATQCVAEVRATGAVEASFKMSVPPIVCTAAENDGLASLDTQIEADQKSLLKVKDEINQLQSQRPLFQFKECAAYADNAESAAKRREILQERVVQAELDTKDATTRMDAGRTLATRLADLKAPADICFVENKDLRTDVNEFVFELDPVFVGIQCPGTDDAPKNPVQIVINEINAEILALLEVHISEDEIAALEAERDDKLQEFRELAARLAAIEQSKASPEQVQEQTDTNASLRQTIDDIEARIVSLENEIRDLNGILANNAGMIEDIDALNQRLVELSAQKERRQIALDETKSTSLGALAVISQRDLEISKLEDQISNLKIQMEAASSTSSTLVEEVVQLGQDIADTTQRVTTLEANVSEAQALIDNANGAIGQKSQEVSNLDAELSKKVAEATILSNSVTTLAPQADAAETTVEGMRASLETDYVPIAQFQEKAARLNELTQAVTERTKLIQELRLDLGSIEQEEQLLIKMCVADAQCKAAMGERLGVDQ
ncbi:hypothetical protein OAD29_00030 [bacterium]|nr:hypothetical protein [bacterium]